MKRTNRISFILGVVAVIAVGCQGDAGPAGPPGDPGAPGVHVGALSGRVTDVETGAAIAAASVTTSPLDRAATADAEGRFVLDDLPVGVYTLTAQATGYAAGSATVSVVAEEEIEVTIALDVPDVTTGTVAGTVFAHGATPTAVAGAQVALVDAFALAASAERAPLEPLAAASPYVATTAADGSYTIDGIAPGRYFAHVLPPEGDAEVLLPGGGRESFEVAADAAATVDVTLSQQPSPAAQYLGSGACLVCHSGEGPASKHVDGWKNTLHALVYRVPGQTTAAQDLSLLPAHDRALAFFVDGNARDNTGAGDGLGLRIARAEFPAFPAAYNLLLGYDGQYFVRFETPAGVASMKYYASFTFGGHGVYKERWVTRVSTDGSHDPTPGGASSYYILPLQYDENLPDEVEPFHPYNAANWGPPTVADGAAVRPAQAKSFDNNCAGCHFTGTTLTRDGEGNFHADASHASTGPLDYDGDGDLDEMTIGCERCHGPGSEHTFGGPAIGKRIIVPSLLTAERSSAICGQCHTRGEGRGAIDGIPTEMPSAGDGTLTFPMPGQSLATFLGTFYVEHPGVYADDGAHSRQHHQQWNDFAKSTHNKNPYDLLACDSCHDNHSRDIGPSLRASVDDNELCLSCHGWYQFGLGAPPWLPPESWTAEEEAEAVSAHMQELADMTTGYDPLDLSGRIGDPKVGGVGRCTSCHMPKTAASQSRFVHEAVDGAGQPVGPRVRGDVSSHAFDIITPAASQVLKNAGGANSQLPNSCGACHNALTGIAPTYTY